MYSGGDREIPFVTIVIHTTTVRYNCVCIAFWLVKITPAYAQNTIFKLVKSIIISIKQSVTKMINIVRWLNKN